MCDMEDIILLFNVIFACPDPNSSITWSLVHTWESYLFKGTHIEGVVNPFWSLLHALSIIEGCALPSWAILGGGY